MKTTPRLLLVSSLSLTMGSSHEALAGCCGSNKCNATFVAPSVPSAPSARSAPATTSASYAFTAIGGSRVADVNLSQEGLDRYNAGDKEEPLPKGFSTAADRAKLAARPTPLYGWYDNEISRPSRNRVRRTLLRGSIAKRTSPRKSFAHVAEAESRSRSAVISRP